MPLPSFNEDVVIFEFETANANPPEKDKIVFKKMSNMGEYLFTEQIKEFQADSADMYRLICSTYLVYVTMVYADFYMVVDDNRVPYFDILPYLDGTYTIRDTFDAFHKKIADVPFDTVKQIFNFAFQANPDCFTIIKDTSPPI